MTTTIILFIFPILLVVLPLALYKSDKPYMARFYERMLAREKMRKLYAQIVLIVLLLFHYIYSTQHIGDFGIVVSTILCATLFSFKRSDRWLTAIREQRRKYLLLALLSVATAFTPHLYTMGVTLAFLLLAASFYPSTQLRERYNTLSPKQREEFRQDLVTEYFNNNHHAECHEEVDSGTDNPST